jgi:hypothetical protein
MNTLKRILRPVTPPVAEPAPVEVLSDEKFEKLLAILKSIGMDDPTAYGFDEYLRDPRSYFGGSFEWTEREAGLRYWFDVANGRMYRATVTKHGYTSVAPGAITEANRRLEELFAS